MEGKVLFSFCIANRMGVFVFISGHNVDHVLTCQ